MWFSNPNFRISWSDQTPTMVIVPFVRRYYMESDRGLLDDSVIFLF